ncbi:hypothetical protein IVB18_33430 [Bradyrhizobium sp. 186]|uniref:hypothetical protein n=1 Tax=Bradyrhizobium sp. 186 TaxID=2782654 RepID=UPI002000F488|nr:hypothetical protein [Bradyrhizobium sp. 186]UPK33101.1 hypothetical protein IVB18_33430 [Bradyrhizobium sp. 186]
MLSPERYQGHILLQDARIPLTTTVSADSSGELKFDVEPLLFEGQQSALLKLMQTLGKSGTEIAEFGLECSSESGKQLKSERVFLAGYSHKSGILEISLEAYEAELRIQASQPSPPTLQFRLRGIRSFGPGLNGTTRLGKVYARGMTEVSGPYAITGHLTVRAPEGELPANWHGEANDLLLHLRMALSFANGGHLSSPIVEYWVNDTLTVTFCRTGSSGTSELPVQHFLNLQPFFYSVAANFDAARHNRDALANAIGWLHVETTHDEVRFLSGMTALEHLASHHLPEQSRQLIAAPDFEKLRSEIEALLEQSAYLSDDVKQALKVRLEGLNRQSLVQNIRALFDLWGVSKTDITNKMLRRLVTTRNDIVHRGIATDRKTLWDLIVIVREINARLIFALLKFEGNYECYMGGRHMRQFPSCERIPNS